MNVYHANKNSPRRTLRMIIYSNWKKPHRYQLIYTSVLNGFLTILRIPFKGFLQGYRHRSNGSAKRYNGDYFNEWCILVLTKVVYIGYVFVLPLILTSLLWWQVLLVVLMMHWISGPILALIFQRTQIVEGNQFSLLHESHLTRRNDAYRLLNTATLGDSNKWISCQVRRLNFRVVHHLLPNMRQVRYRKIVSIVRTSQHEFVLSSKHREYFAKQMLVV